MTKWNTMVRREMRQQQQQRRGLAFPFPISTSPHPHNPTPLPITLPISQLTKSPADWTNFVCLMMMVKNHAGSERIPWQLFRKMAALISLSCLPPRTPWPTSLRCPWGRSQFSGFAASLTFLSEKSLRFSMESTSLQAVNKLYKHTCTARNFECQGCQFMQK